MNLQQLSYFKTISELESYTKASERLHIAQSSLSHSISELENELGVPLFIKSGRNIKTSEYGLEFLKYVTYALESIEAGIDATQKMVNPYIGTVRLEFVDTLTPYYIPQMLKSFYEDEAHKDIHITMRQKATKLILESFQERQVDLGFGSFVGNTNMTFFPIMNEEMVVIVSTQHPLAARDSVDLRELKNEKLVTYNMHSGTRPYIDACLKRFDIAMEIACEVETDTMLVGFVSTNVGVGIMPKMYSLGLYDVKALKIINSAFSRPLYMFWPRDEFMRPVVKKLRDFIMDSTPGAALPR